MGSLSREIKLSLERSCPYSGEREREREEKKEGRGREIDCQHHPKKRELPGK